LVAIAPFAWISTRIADEPEPLFRELSAFLARSSPPNACCRWSARSIHPTVEDKRGITSNGCADSRVFRRAQAVYDAVAQHPAGEQPDAAALARARTAPAGLLPRRVDPLIRSRGESSGSHRLIDHRMHSRRHFGACARVFAARRAAAAARAPAQRWQRGRVLGPEAVVALNTRILDAFDLTWTTRSPLHACPRCKRSPRNSGNRRASCCCAIWRRCAVRDEGSTLHAVAALLDRRDAVDGIDARPVVIMRPWQDVVASLVRRDATSPESAALLYVAYGLAAAQALDAGASFVTYDQLVADWRGCRIALPSSSDSNGMPMRRMRRISLRTLRPAQADGARVALPASIEGWADTDVAVVPVRRPG
jgi:hypothetical protein